MKKYLFALAAFWTIGIALNPSLEWGEVSVCRRCRQGKGKSNSGYDGCCGCCGATRKTGVPPYSRDAVVCSDDRRGVVVNAGEHLPRYFSKA
ncbi:hypothetical protein BD310DRAFT_181822 [Dichomitus squalens]|uniref:Uncharacterized protein n=1 Tax=Dichomitus squalens TaxID=114155 RepID=A0A4V2K6Q3_9APHY|nr:hypothetical protein BD310DRAFT_181822 [Dichomitus squalens]